MNVIRTLARGWDWLTRWAVALVLAARDDRISRATIDELIDLERTQRQAECDCECFGSPDEITIKICGAEGAPCGPVKGTKVEFICDRPPGEADHPLFFQLSHPITERLRPSVN